jgi:hypothetical protein
MSTKDIDNGEAKSDSLSTTRRGAMALAGLSGLGLLSGAASANDRGRSGNHGSGQPFYNWREDVHANGHDLEALGNLDVSAIGTEEIQNKADVAIEGQEVAIAHRVMSGALDPETITENETALPGGELRTGDVYFEVDRAEPWDITNAEFTGVRFDFGDRGDNIRSTEFRPDGRLMYQLSRANETVTQFRLEEPWRISTVEEVGVYNFADDLILDRGWDGSAGHGLWLRNGDGGRMYVWNRREIYQYEIDDWDVTSAEKVGFKNLDDEVTRGHDIDFKPDGSRLYLDDRTEEAVFEYTLSEDWNIETAELNFKFDISSQEEAVRGIEFDNDGKRMFLCDTGLRQVHEYELETAWELSTAAFTGNILDLAETSNPRSITWRRDGERFFITDRDEGDIFKYDIDTDAESASLHVRGETGWIETY